MKEKALQYLKDHAPGYVSGEVLGKKLGVSRTAVWKYIGELKREGYVIESSSKRGYSLKNTGNLLNAFEIGYKLETEILGRDIRCLDAIDSTNNYAKQIASQGCAEGTVVVADVQTAGRGRLGRSWQSKGGKGIWMSVILRPQVSPENVQLITLAASVAVISAVKKVTGLEAGIKWPNDIILDGKKVCGILTEMSSEMEQVNFIVLGIGLNVNHGPEDFAGDLINLATSLKIHSEAGRGGTEISFERSSLIKGILLALEKIYYRLKAGEVPEILSEWKQYSVTLGKEVRVISHHSEYVGTAEDITGDGRLVVRCRDGAVREFVSGEVSVRGVLGYA